VEFTRGAFGKVSGEGYKHTHIHTHKHTHMKQAR
jgi:hypothetical protein